MTDAVIRVEGLKKEFRQGFFMRRVLAVKDVSFQVQRGDIFGFLGPNGAGKTTTIKMLTGLIRPSAGKAELFGQPIPSQPALGKSRPHISLMVVVLPAPLGPRKANSSPLAMESDRSRTATVLP